MEPMKAEQADAIIEFTREYFQQVYVMRKKLAKYDLSKSGMTKVMIKFVLQKKKPERFTNPAEATHGGVGDVGTPSSAPVVTPVI